MRTFVVGDIHGNYKALMQCIQRSAINYETDRLIVLGDIVDSFPEIPKCIDEVLKFKHLVYVLGNHDQWFIWWYNQNLYELNGKEENLWTRQGGTQTKICYGGVPNLVPREHKQMFNNAVLSYVQDDKIFVHGGIVLTSGRRQQHRDTLLWDRQLVETMWHWNMRNPDRKFSAFDEIFVGHTQTANYNKKHPEKWYLPQHLCNLWMLDTGAGWDGKLTIMDVDTHEYWQSDLAYDLYPSYKGRKAWNPYEGMW